MENNINLQFIDYKVTKSTFNVLGSYDNKIDIQFKTIQNIIDEFHFTNSIDITINEDKGGLYINVVIEGNFKIIGDIPQEIRESFIRINSTSIMFPFLRSYIASLTSLSGVPPLVLPLFNIAEMQ